MAEREKERSRWERKCQRLEKKLKEQEEKAEAYRQLQDISNALLAQVLEAAGADREHPLEVRRITGNADLNRCRVMGTMSETGDAFLLHYEQQAQTDQKHGS